MSLALRPATPLDAGKLGAIMTETGRLIDWKPRLHSGAEDIAFCATMIDRGWVTVAEDATNGVTGFLARNATEVNALFVAPGRRDAGIGTALLQNAKAQSPRLELWTFQRNIGAQRFYQRAGFRETGRTDGQTNDENLPDIRYLWEAPT